MESAPVLIRGGEVGRGQGVGRGEGGGGTWCDVRRRGGPRFVQLDEVSRVGVTLGVLLGVGVTVGVASRCGAGSNAWCRRWRRSWCKSRAPHWRWE